MRLLRGLHNPGLAATGCVATIGNFDGVHRGHQSIIDQLKSRAKAMGLPAVAMVFEPQPLEFFCPDQAPARLMRFRDKFEALRSLGLDYVFCLKFDEALSKLSAPDFVRSVLLDHLSVRHLVVGDDFRFGDEREGDFALLREMGLQYGFSVENTPTQLESSGLRISSTAVRDALSDADFERAEQLLGRPYQIQGRVIHGQKMGRQLGFPTANIALRRLKSALSGVYTVKLQLDDGVWHNGVANVGVKPSVGKFPANLEVHLLDFQANIYGQSVKVEFLSKLRDEQRFDGLDALKAQITQDLERARTYFVHA